MTLFWSDGLWLDSADFSITPTDRGLLHGLGLFETMLAIDGRAMFLDRHLSRLERGCQQLGWNSAIPDVSGPIASLGQGSFKVRLTVTAGSGALDDIAQGADHLWMLTANPITERAERITLNLSPFTRNERSAIVGLKCTSYAENLVALDHARRLGFQETLFFNSAGHLCEAATSNVFLVREGALFTPALDCGCLPGITRALVIELAAKHGIACHEGTLTAADLHAACEIFLTSSIRGVTGVSTLENRAMPSGAVTDNLSRAWNQRLKCDASKLSSSYEIP